MSAEKNEPCGKNRRVVIFFFLEGGLIQSLTHALPAAPGLPADWRATETSAARVATVGPATRPCHTARLAAARDDAASGCPAGQGQATPA